MTPVSDTNPPRILIVDDNPGIHRDFKLVLLDELPDAELQADEQRLFAAPAQAAAKPPYVVDDAFSGHEALDKVKQALAEQRPYQVAFVDVRMPGIDGVETISRLWKLDDRLQIVICTAYSDYSWSDLARRLGSTDKLLVLKKPFDTIEVIQLASTLSEKWNLAIQANLKLEQMELLVGQRTQKLLDSLRRQDVEPVRQDQKQSSTSALARNDSSGNGDEAALSTQDSPILLLVEHDAEFVSALNQALSSNYQIVVAENSQKAFDLAREIVPDVIAAEISAPELDGIALCRRLKADELAGHIPILMLGLARMEELHIKALEAGADDCAVRPFTPLLFKARIDHLVRARRKPTELRHPLGPIQPRDVAKSQLDAQFLRRAINTVERFLSDFEFDVDVFARKMGMSRRQLFRKLKAVADCTPNLFIRNLRLNRAAQLLLNSEMTVTEITYAIGFSDLKHFRTVFRECFGVLPGEYTSQHQRPTMGK